MRVIEELRRRNVIRVAVAYAAVAWLILQAADLVLPAVEAAPWNLKTIAAILISGFPVTVVLAWFFERTPEGVRRDTMAGSRHAGPGRSARRFDLVVIGVLAVALLMLVLDSFVLTRRPEVRAIREPSIAVLPFKNTSYDLNQRYFSDGIAEDIHNALSGVNTLQVAGQHSSFAFRGRRNDLRQIGATLGVAHVLEGSVRKVGNRVDITARLVAVDTGTQIWSKVFEEKLSDVFAIQDEIFAATVKELSAGHIAEEPAIASAKPAETEAYDLFLLARHRIYLGTRPMLESAARLLDRAIELDPAYAPAYAQRGIVELLLFEGNYDTKTLDAALRGSKAYLDQSIGLDSNLAEGWAGLGLYHLTAPNQYRDAIEVLRKAIAINPGLIDAKNWLKNAFIASGDVEAGHAMVEEMTRQDPLYRPGFTGAVNSYNQLGQHDKAFALIDQVKPFMPDDPSVLWAEGSTHLYMGNIATAYSLLEDAFERIPDNAEARMFFGWALIGTRQVGRVAIEGGADQKIAALDQLGRNLRAAQLAQRFSADGVILPLLQHYNRAGQSDVLIDFVDSKWPDLGAFEAAYPPDAFGHEEMAELAYAYSRTADPRFEAALQRVGQAIDRLASFGIDNWLFERNRAIYLALATDNERALASLGQAIDRGYRDIVPLAAARPAFAGLSSDPRFELLELQIRRQAQHDRELLGLL